MSGAIWAEAQAFTIGLAEVTAIRQQICELAETIEQTTDLPSIGSTVIRRGPVGINHGCAAFALPDMTAEAARCASAHSTRHTDVRSRVAPSTTNGTASRLTAATDNQTAPGHSPCTMK